MARKRVGRHPMEFRWMAIERNSCENIVALANALGIQRTLRYKWRKKFEADEAIGDPVPVNLNAREGRLRKELSYVKRLLAEKRWIWIFSEAPCNESRLDASETTRTAKASQEL
jgi:transposase-like protein